MSALKSKLARINSQKVPPFSKCFYFGFRELFAGASTGINFDKYEDIPVEATGNNAPNPVHEVNNSLAATGSDMIDVAKFICNELSPSLLVCRGRLR